MDNNSRCSTPSFDNQQQMESWQVWKDLQMSNEGREPIPDACPRDSPELVVIDREESSPYDPVPGCVSFADGLSEEQIDQQVRL